MTQKTKLREEDLIQFTGSETWYRHGLFRNFLYTDGVQYVAETGKAYWLIDKIFSSHACLAKLEGEEFCVWDLTLNKDGQGAKLVCTDGNDTELYTEEREITLYELYTVIKKFKNDKAAGSDAIALQLWKKLGNR